MDIKQLKKLWLSEREQYRTTEVGSGVQKFVKEVFKSSDIFNLLEGKLSTDIKKRKYEFIEEAKKKGNRADVVIFIDSDVIIPVEIERYGNIQAGEKQIIQYQSDWQKKLGLLTDGKEWRFYNNLFVERTFSLEDILEKTKEFLTFWNEYTKTEYYYKSFFQKKDEQRAFEFAPANVDDARQEFFSDITLLIDTFKNKLKLKGYFKDVSDELEKDRKAVEITYAYFIQFILYKTLVDNAFADFEEDWALRLKSIAQALNADVFGDILSKIKGISDKISARVYKRFNDEQLVINDRLKEILEKPSQIIGDISVWLDILLFISRYNFANVQNEIFGYVYENYLKDLYLDEKKGQYFTDPHIVEFMLTEMGFTKEELRKRYGNDKNSISIIDPSCGSGTFLYNATARLVEAFFDGSEKSAKETETLIHANIYGLDIAEFPLYLAEMNILMRMLPIIIGKEYNNPMEKKLQVFKTQDSISEFLDTSIRNTLTDLNQEFKTKGAAQLNLFTEALELGYESFMRSRSELEGLKQSIESHNGFPRLRFDYVIGNPPYVGYNECASQDILIFKMMREGNIKLNDIYGINLHSVPSQPKRYRPNPNLYAFFICVGLALLKDNGVISFIIPQTMLTAGDLDVIRFHISNYATIEKIFLFENKLFIGRGILQTKPIPTSSLVFVLRKIPPVKSHKVKIIRYEKSDSNIKECLKNINSRRNTKVINIAQTILQKNYPNWNFLKFSEKYIKLIDFYNLNTENFNIYFIHSISEKLIGSKFIFDGGYSIDEKSRLNSIPDNDYYIYPKFNNKTYSQILPRGYWPNHRNKEESHYIGLRQGSQDYLLLDSEFKIVWSYANPLRFYFTDKPIIWARNQFNSIGSNNKSELLYLFALLNSKINFHLLKSYLISKNEKDFLLSLTSIKNFIRVPQIHKSNKHIKSEIISQAEELIDMEKHTLSDFVDFSKLLLQKFDSLNVEGNDLIIYYKGNTAKCKITGETEFIEKCIDNYLNSDLFTDFGSISDFKQFAAYDVVLQEEIKDYIDDLVFSLYFKIELPELGFNHRFEIKELCKINNFYNIINCEEDGS